MQHRPKSKRHEQRDLSRSRKPASIPPTECASHEAVTRVRGESRSRSVLPLSQISNLKSEIASSAIARLSRREYVTPRTTKFTPISHFLIATAARLEFAATRTKQTPKLFLIATKTATFCASQSRPLPPSCCTPPRGLSWISEVPDAR